MSAQQPFGPFRAETVDYSIFQRPIGKRVPLAPLLRFDPHALAMALQLAKELQGTWANQHKYRGRWESVSDWLRAEVQKELEAQP